MSCRKNPANWRLHDDYSEVSEPLIACILDVHGKRKPAKHTKGSVLWHVLSGGGFVLFQHNLSGGWVLGYLGEGESWLARKDHLYYFVPQIRPFQVEATCYSSEAFGRNLEYPDFELPTEACIYVEGEVIEVGEDFIALLRHGIATKYVLLEDDVPRSSPTCLAIRLGSRKRCRSSRFFAESATTIRSRS